MAKKPKVKISVDPDYPLPPELRQDDCGTHPYVRGLTSHRWADERRHRLHHPVIMFMTIFIAFCRDIYGFMTPLDKQMATYVGDYPYFMHCKSQLNLARYPFPESPIRLMAGAVTPRSVGLFDEAVIIEMCKSAKFWFHHTKTNTNLVGLAAFIMCVFSVHFGVNDWSMFPIYFPWGVINAMGIRYVFNISHWTYTYFYLICFYHKARIYADIIENNDRFFKTFSIIFLPLFMVVIDCTIFTEFFSELPLVTRFVVGYQLLSGTFVILSYLRVVSSVAEESKKAYKPLHKLQTTLKTNSNVCRYKWQRLIYTTQTELIINRQILRKSSNLKQFETIMKKCVNIDCISILDDRNGRRNLYRKPALAKKWVINIADNCLKLKSIRIAKNIWLETDSVELLYDRFGSQLQSLSFGSTSYVRYFKAMIKNMINCDNSSQLKLHNRYQSGSTDFSPLFGNASM
ncbi:unnamed protein product, partial [Medioppia subpectinata]